MKHGYLTKKQFSAAVFTASLAPLTRLTPRFSAALGGRGAWLGAVPAFAVLMLLTLLLKPLRRAMLPGEGMGGLILRLTGPLAGRLLLALYGGLFLLMGGILLRTGAERLAAAAYPQSRSGPFMLVLIAVSLLIALGSMRAAGRMAAVMRAVLTASLALVFLLAAQDVSLRNLFPLGISDLPRAAVGGLPVVTAGAAAALFTFLDGCRAPGDPVSPRDALPHTALFCGIAALLCLETVGAYGPTLTARLTYPYFTLTRDVILWGLAQRIEAVVIALWVFADIVMCVLLLRCAYETFRRILRLPDTDGDPLFLLRRGRWLLWASAAGMLAAGLFLGAEPRRLQVWSETLLPLFVLLSVFAGFPLLWIAGRVRKKL